MSTMNSVYHHLYFILHNQKSNKLLQCKCYKYSRYNHLQNFYYIIYYRTIFKCKTCLRCLRSVDKWQTLYDQFSRSTRASIEKQVIRIEFYKATGINNSYFLKLVCKHTSFLKRFSFLQSCLPQQVYVVEISIIYARKFRISSFHSVLRIDLSK